MILIFFLCLKLSILHLCVSDHGYQCGSKPENDSRKIQINLVQENNNDVASVYQEKFNKAFKLYCQDYYDIHIRRLNQINRYENIIRFAVPDYYDGKQLNNFVYAGNISKNDIVNCTKKTYYKVKPVYEYDCHEFANLVSETVYKMNDGHLHNFVQAMDYKNENYVELTTTRSCEPLRNTSDLTVVLLCLREENFIQREVNLKDLKLIQVPLSECDLYFECRDKYLVNPSLQYDLMPQVDFPYVPTLLWDEFKCLGNNLKYKNRLLAVLAPGPVRDRGGDPMYEIISESLVPAVFYETPYMYSETKTGFPNSINLVPWRLLKYAFLKFIQTVGWHRVAIVSDDSEYSVAFEDELTALFRKEKDIVHTVIRCEDDKCNMGKLAQKLNEAAAWIIIANVEEKNAQFLIRNTNHVFTWLLRDINEKIEGLADRQVAFSFSLHTDTKTKDCDVEDNILTGLSGIAQAYENTKKYASTQKKREFYRIFTDELQRVTPRITEAEIVINRISKYASKEISRMSVNANGVTRIHNKIDPFPKGKPNDGMANCLVTTYDYYNPCDNSLVLLFMFTLMLFVLTILLITCYFDKTSPFNDVRYQHF